MDDFLKVDERTFGVRSSVLSASADDEGALRLSFEVHAEGAECFVEMDGYLAVPRSFAAGDAVTIVLDDAQREELIYYEHDHLPFRGAEITFTPRQERIELRVAGEVVDPGDGNRVLAISVQTATSLEQVSVRPKTEREAREVLARTGLTGELVWTEMPNGLWTFYSPARAKSEAALAELAPKVRELSRGPVLEAAGLPVDRAALHASPELLRRAKAVLRDEVERRWPKEVRALLPAAAAALRDLLLRI